MIVNSDAHRPEDVGANIDDGLAIAKQFNLKIAKFDFKDPTPRNAESGFTIHKNLR